MKQFDPNQRRRAIELLENLPWGDMENSIPDFELALRLLMDATEEEFRLWEGSGEGARYGGDEFSVSSEQVAAMTPEWKLAYVGRLIRTLGMAYGIRTDYGGGPLSMHDSGDSPATLLRTLLDIVVLPIARRDDSAL